jgi:UDP-N-acetylglucosamine 2-epimerase (non-hydrolysing)
MSQVFFDELGIPSPDIHLGVGSASHAVQTARIILAFEQVLLEHRPDLVLVVGDVNSTVACAITAVKLHVPVVHVEAGLRSFNRTMPEEINRVVTDALSELLFTTERAAIDNLLREGIARERIHFVGNVMIDTLHANLDRARQLDVVSSLALQPKGYALLTLHRPANVDDRDVLMVLFQALAEISTSIPILFPNHPRTRKRLEEFGLDEILCLRNRMVTCEPLGYLAFLNAMSNALFVLTDSGGIQEETTALGIPCLTLRQETERPATVTHGTNVVVGTDPVLIRREADRILEGRGIAGRMPEKWDGRAAERIASVLWQVYGSGKRQVV